MKILKIYESLIKEKETASNVSFCIKAFGHELFGDQLGGNERNTEIEDDYLRLINRFTSDEYGVSITPEFMEAIDHLASCASKYPEVLVTQGKVYRGTRIPFEDVFNMINNFDENNLTPYVYNANTPIQSWTEGYDTALTYSFGPNHNKIPTGIREFSKVMGNYKSLDDRGKIKILNSILDRFNFLGHYVPVMLSVNAENDEFLFKAKYFRKLSEYHDEDEVLRISKRPLNCILECDPIVAYITKEINKFQKELGIDKSDFSGD